MGQSAVAQVAPKYSKYRFPQSSVQVFEKKMPMKEWIAYEVLNHLTTEACALRRHEDWWCSVDRIVYINIDKSIFHEIIIHVIFAMTLSRFL